VLPSTIKVLDRLCPTYTGDYQFDMIKSVLDWVGWRKAERAQHFKRELLCNTDATEKQVEPIFLRW
jgi:hypothetical protein